MISTAPPRSLVHPTEQTQINRGLAWVGFAASIVAILDIIATLVILRLWLSKEQYGVATTVVTLFGAVDIASEMGIGSAIVARPGHSQQQLSTLFWLNGVLAIALYAVIFVTAPAFAALHDEPALTGLVRVFGLMLLLRVPCATHQAILKRDLRFKEVSMVRVSANLGEFIAKIAAAALGAGVWCFIVGPLARSMIYGIGMPLTCRWLPSLTCRPKTVIGDLKYGFRTSSSEFIYQFYCNLDYQVVGYFFGAAALGVYRAAYDLVLEPVRFISGVVTAVAFPTIAKLRGNTKAVTEQFLRFTKQNLMVVLPFVAIILVTADDALVVLLGEQYLGVGNTVRLLTVVGVLRSLSHLGPPVLDGLQQAALTQRYQVVAASTLCTCFIASAALLGPSMGMLSVALAWAVGYPLPFGFLLCQIQREVHVTLGQLHAATWPVVRAIAVACAVGTAAQVLLAGPSLILRFGIVVTLMATMILAQFWMSSHRQQRPVSESLPRDE